MKYDQSGKCCVSNICVFAFVVIPLTQRPIMLWLAAFSAGVLKGEPYFHLSLICIIMYDSLKVNTAERGGILCKRAHFGSVLICLCILY